MNSIYLDWAATAPPDPEILEQSGRIARTHYANPSAVHKAGREAERLLCECRQRMAALLGCEPAEIVFTSGATEANNMLLFSQLHKKRDHRILISGIEHPSIDLPARTLKRLGFELAVVPADSTGRIDPERIHDALDEHTTMVSVMTVNNETGSIQPVREIARAVREHEKRSGKKILLHTDAVQAFGKIPFSPYSLGVDGASLSAHKIGGPRGVGALFVAKGRIAQVLYSGGGQENGLRPGTENLPGIFGFVLASEKAAVSLEANHRRAEQAMGGLIERLAAIPDVVLNPAGRSGRGGFSPYILNFSIPPLPGEVLVRVLEEEELTLSTGSACSSKKPDRFRVLENMGVPRKVAFSSLRLSIGPGIDSGPLNAVLKALERRLPGLRANIRD